ncbi:MAG: HMA2 domain-containing protein [Gammaproteobacteria bacterium]
MGHYIHHVPGRLRVRSPKLKCSAARARQLIVALESLPGVQSVTQNQRACSMVILYAPSEIDVESLLSVLRQSGCLEADQTADRQSAGMSMAGALFGKALFGAFFQSTLERSVLSLVTALK